MIGFDAPVRHVTFGVVKARLPEPEGDFRLELVIAQSGVMRSIGRAVPFDGRKDRVRTRHSGSSRLGQRKSHCDCGATSGHASGMEEESPPFVSQPAQRSYRRV
nr:hypothetical protein FNV92_30680 [Bradyrhizobium cosmicum]